MTQIIKLPVGNVPAAQAVVDAIQKRCYDPHPVLKELRRDVFYGGHVWLLLDDLGQPLSLNCTKPGKRRKNLWEPYANWYTAYTPVPFRQQGYAKALYKQVETELVEAGCRRIKSLAGSVAGLALHMSVGHLCWGLTGNNEVFVDSPLPGSEHLYAAAPRPAQAPAQRLTLQQLLAISKKGLRYDQV